MKITLNKDQKATLRYLFRLTLYFLAVLNCFAWILVFLPSQTVREKKSPPLKVKIVNQSVKLPNRNSAANTPKRIHLEPNLKETKAPEKADVFGLKNRTVKNRTRSKPEDSSNKKATSENANSNSSKKKSKNRQQSKNQQSSPKNKQTSKKGANKQNASPNAFGRVVAKPYEKFLMTSESLAEQEIIKGYANAPKQFIDDTSLPFGISTDINIKEYRLAGYFVHIEQAVQQAFFSPNTKKVVEASKKSKPVISEYAQALIQIDNRGNIRKVEIIGSSGNPILNQHWITVLQSAGPFPPLPTKSGLKELKFSYKLHFGGNTF